MLAPEVDLEAIATGLAAEFPDAGTIAPCSVLGWGFGSVVVETAGGVVFRVARIPGVHEAFAWQRALLEVLGPRLPVATPQPRWMTGPSASFPHGAIGYAKVPGILLTEELFEASDRDAFAGDIATFVAALHGISAAETPMLRHTSPEERMRKERGVYAQVMPVLREHFDTIEIEHAEAWWAAYLNDPAMMIYEPCVTHGDLWWGNLLVDESGSRLLGVLDWEVASIADPARDFAGLGYLGVPFMEHVLDEYAEITGAGGDALRHRTRLVFQVREFYGVRYAAQYPQHRELDEALAKVRRVLATMPV